MLHVVESICQALWEKAITQGVRARSTELRSCVIHAFCCASCPALMVQLSAQKAIQCTWGVSKEYQRLELEPELLPTFCARARLRSTNWANSPPPCVP
jgi:hypothetical protein